MDTVAQDRKASRKNANRLSFNIGNLLLLIALIGISLGWWVDRNGSHSDEYDVQGLIKVSYTIRKSPNSISGGVIENAEGIDFRGSNIVIFKMDSGVVLPANNLIDFRWQRVKTLGR